MRALVTASVELPGIAATDAFAAMVDLDAQQRWMIATRLYPVQSDVPVPLAGSRVAAFTGVGGVGFLDTMTVTAYEPPHRWVVDKDGDLLRGVGTMRVTPATGGCRATWTNELTLPYGPLGRLAFPLVRPVAELAMLACLHRLARMLGAGALPGEHRPPVNERKVQQ